MSEDYGNGVSRTLSAKNNQFQVVVWQANKPPLDSELNLIGQIEWEKQAQQLRAMAHSGWLIDPMASDTDFVTNQNWSNWFKFGRNDHPLFANVNGWVIPVSGTAINEATNRINLFPSPDTDSRIDLVFLEVWSTLVAPNPSIVNKPNAQTIWKYGNVEYGGANIADDLEDPNIGFETTKRVQLQYRIRVMDTSVDLNQYPDGLDDPNVLAQGTTTSPIPGFAFTNMKDELGDSGLWRAGDGDPNNSLGTIDGYSYAIPLCAVFRRNKSPFVARINSGNANQMGGLDRNPRSTPIVNRVDGTRSFSPVTLTTDLVPSATGAILVDNLVGSGLDNTDIDWTSTFLTINGEIIGIDSVDVGASTITISDGTTRQGRGRWGTQDTYHASGSTLEFFNFRPDGKFTDEISDTDILDLRKGITLGEWDYQTLLQHNLDKLLKGHLKSSHKQGNGTDTQGVQFIEVDTLLGVGGGTLPNQTEQLDGFDGVRTHFSDSVVVQRGVTNLLNPVSTGSVNPTPVSDFTIGAGSWDVAPDFAVSGFQPRGDQGWVEGTVIRLWIGGANGNSGARGTTQNSDNRFMRFVSPKEYWLEQVQDTRTYNTPSLVSPIDMQFQWSTPSYDFSAQNESQRNVGPVAPNFDSNFETPFIFLGGVVNNNLLSTSAVIHASSSPQGYDEVSISGLDFDTVGGWYNVEFTDKDTLSTQGITNLVVHGTKNIFNLITNGGKDLSGMSSELFLVITDDLTNPGNCGCFRVIGLGTVMGTYTSVNGSAQDRLVVVPVSTGGAVVDGQTVRVETRSLDTNTQDGPASSSVGAASAVIVLGDLSTRDDYPVGNNTSRMVLTTSIAYGGSRGGTARVADFLDRFSVVNPPANLLKEAPSALDPVFDNESGVPENEVYFSANNPNVWSQTQSMGCYPPFPVNIGDGSGEYGIDKFRESECFVDEGSKTVIFRPFQKKAMSMFLSLVPPTRVSFPTFYDDGVTVVDGANIKAPQSGGEELVYPVPLAYMPKFGRQDIPVRKQSSNTLFGINHLFADESGNAPSGSDVYAIIGGRNASTPTDGGVFPMYLTTEIATTRPYGGYGLITGSVSAYQGRMYEDLNGRSSDSQKKLYGIQLPPFMGVARVYGIYDARDWNNTNGSSAWQQDRVSPKTTGTFSTNLIKTNADKQTLWILKDGASDVETGGDAHTYMIPQDAVDIKLSPSYTTGEDFKDLEYVVEMEVFLFARGFINKNNFVLARAYGGNGTVGGDTTLENLTSINMVIPSAMPSGSQGYVAYTRTPYQGDPYMTRDGETLQPADYEHRYGGVSTSESFELTKAIQQFYTDNTQTPEHVNCRSLEVLAAQDFWTTLGTGRVGGLVKTMDTGYVESGSKLPMSATSNPKQPQVRAFTQEKDGSLGTVQVVISDNSIVPSIFGITVNTNTKLTQIVSQGVDANETAQNIVNAFANVSASLGLSLYAVGNTVYFTNLVGGQSDNLVVLGVNTGIGIVSTSGLVYSSVISGDSAPTNALRTEHSVTPIKLTGCTERLPLGILLQDSDFIGEDPTRQGQHLAFKDSGLSSELSLPLDPQGKEYGRLGLGGFLGMSDGGILKYTPYVQGVTDTGTKRFRLYRGGGSVYNLSTEQDSGAPIDFGMDGFSSSDQPVLKGSVLAGRAYLVRNYKETALTGDVVRSYGDELQMVVVTTGVVGNGAQCPNGYALQGIISPTGYGEGYSASDRYRLEGKPMYQKGSEKAPNCDVFIAPFPSTDPTDDPCA